MHSRWQATGMSKGGGAERRGDGAAGRGETPAGGASSVLIVEDDADLRAVLVEALTMEGYAVQKAANGGDALDIARMVPPGLIILDLMMPVMDGWEFREHQKRDQRLRQVPVVAMSAALPYLGRHPIDVDGFICKPMELSALLSLVRRFVGPPANAPATVLPPG
ncbi:MAG TPA: response regulator [Anaeromyxobacteraceae bacterium]|nr:response regulator [Anaeromyxobacteraceae bacterium]